MRRFTLFTLLYLATGICLTAIALQYPDMTPNAKTSLLVSAGLLYLCAVFTTFPFWHQSVQRFQARLRDKPVWQQKFVAIAPWLVIASVLVSAIASVEAASQPWSFFKLAKIAQRAKNVKIRPKSLLAIAFNYCNRSMSIVRNHISYL
jgi:NADH:ubiquinone oxidoreductase subunit 6 (subunit J)